MAVISLSILILTFASLTILFGNEMIAESNKNI